MSDPSLSLALILVFGVLSQILSGIIKTPSILLLLIVGFIVGPVTNLINPDQLFGDLLFPLVSLAVGIILFEGGLSLKFSEITGFRSLVFSLISLGVLITWILLTLFGFYFLDLSFEISLLLSAILTVTGPTVIIPLLNHVKAKQSVSNVLKWEGILIDPVGATLAVLVFEIIHLNLFEQGLQFLLINLFLTFVIGLLIGLGSAFLFGFLIKNFLISDHLQNPFSFALVIFTFVIANLIQEESGLLAVTVMGIALANMKKVKVSHLLEFKEVLRVLLISSLFIVLAARINIDSLSRISIWNGLAFLAVVILVRLVSVLIVSIKSGLTFKERIFIGFIAPRGIVAASVASIFSLKLTEQFGIEAELIASYVFIIIIGSVLFYSLIATHLARLLGVKAPEGNGIAILGANKFARILAEKLKVLGKDVILFDTNLSNVQRAQQLGLKAKQANLLEEIEDTEVNYLGVGQFLALTSNHEANILACLKLSQHLGSSKVYILPSESKLETAGSLSKIEGGRFLFSNQANYYYLEDLLRSKAELVKEEIVEQVKLSEFLLKFPKESLPVIYINPDQEISFLLAGEELVLQKGGKILLLTA